MNNKKAMELPINIVIMTILGLVLFGIGFSMFTSFAQDGDEIISDLNSQIKNNIASIECQGDDWVCAPSVRITNSKRNTFELFISNRDSSSQSFSVKINGTDTGSTIVNSANCGFVRIYFPTNDITIPSGNSAVFPYTVNTDRVTNIPCSFTTIAEVSFSATNVYKTPLNIRVER